jgi:uncharacterized protein (DUF934 family)
MPKLIKLTDGGPAWADDVFVDVADEDAIPDGPVILSLARFQAEGDALSTSNRPVGVRVLSEEAIEDLAYDLPRIAVVALVFPKFRDGRHYSSARLLREQAQFMVRCGVDAFEPADGSTPEQWAHSAYRFRHVYQRATDDLVPAFEERRG